MFSCEKIIAFERASCILHQFYGYSAHLLQNTTMRTLLHEQFSPDQLLHYAVVEGL